MERARRRRRKHRNPEDFCVPIALCCAFLAFLWLSYYLYFGPSADQGSSFVPISAICLNPLTLIFDQTDSLVAFSALVLVGDLLIYGAIGAYVRKVLHRRSLRKRAAILHGGVELGVDPARGRNVRSA